MALEQSGVLFKKYPIVTGTSATGNNWEKQDFIVEQGDKYKNYIKFTLFGEKTGLLTRIDEGETVKVEFYLGSKGASKNRNELPLYSTPQQWVWKCDKLL